MFPLSRRNLLRAAVLGAASVILAACADRRVEPSPSLGRTPSSAAETDRPTIAPTAEPTPTRSPQPDLAVRIAGLLVVGFRGADLDDAPWLRRALAEGGLGGVILFDRDQATGGSRNIVDPDQVARLVADLRAVAAPRPIFVSIDQEGGVVTRLSPAHGYPPLASEATIGAGTAEAARTWATGLAETLAGAGIDLNFAPVVDLDVNPASPAIGALDRSFGPDPDVVTAMATIELAAHRAAGVKTTLKHFPGIGSSTTNTDFGVADVSATWTRTELEPFRRLIAAGLADLVMAGHVVNDQLDPDRPASLSKATVEGVLRGELAWDGVVVTDDLQAEAITAAFGLDEATLLALEAGDDLLLFANQQAYDEAIVERTIATVTRAVADGRLSVARIDEALARLARMTA